MEFLLVVFLIAVGCGFTALVVSAHYESQQTPQPRALTPEEMTQRTRDLHARTLMLDAEADFEEKLAQLTLKRAEREGVEELLRTEKAQRAARRTR